MQIYKRLLIVCGLVLGVSSLLAMTLLLWALVISSLLSLHENRSGSILTLIVTIPFALVLSLLLFKISRFILKDGRVLRFFMARTLKDI